MITSLAEQGRTILFSTHLMDHVARLCSHVVVINEGCVVARGALDDLRAAHDNADLETIFLDLTAGSTRP